MGMDSYKVYNRNQGIKDHPPGGDNWCEREEDGTQNGILLPNAAPGHTVRFGSFDVARQRKVYVFIFPQKDVTQSDYSAANISKSTLSSAFRKGNQLGAEKDGQLMERRRSAYETKRLVVGKRLWWLCWYRTLGFQRLWGLCRCGTISNQSFRYQSSQ